MQLWYIQMAPVKGGPDTSFTPPWGTCAEQITIMTPGATAQHTEILVVLESL
jgi:hypothetical protein